MGTHRLTNSTVRQMEYCKTGNAADLRFDSDLKGFCVRVYPSGKKTFFISYRNTLGTKKRHKIGAFGVVTASQARKLAHEKLADVLRGNDPQQQLQDRRGEITFEDLATRYLEFTQDRKRSWKADNQRLRDHILPVIGKRKLSEISLAQLQRLHSRVRQKLTPATANRVAALIKHMFSMAGKWGLTEQNPAANLVMFKEPPPRDIVLSPEDCRLILKGCDDDENPFAAALFKLAMLTGRRIGEILNSRWEHVDLEKGIMTLPTTKAGERQFVYLNEQAEQVLRELPRLENNPFVIAGSVPGKALNFYRPAWLRVLKRAGLDYFPPHGLRHNYASTLVAAGVPLEIVGHLLGHKNSTTTRKYAHHRPDHLHKAAEVFSEVVDLGEERKKRSS